MDIRKLAVEETAFVHLHDASDELLYEPSADGTPDQTKAVGVTVYGPGTKIYARAKAAQQTRMLARMRSKGKVTLTAEETAEEDAVFLADCTKSFHYIERDGLEGEALFKAVYADKTTGFIGEQVAAKLGNWANFTKGSPKT